MDLEHIYSIYRRILTDILNFWISFLWGVFIFFKLGYISIDLENFTEFIYELNIKIDLTSLIMLFLIIFLFITPLGISLNAISYFFLEYFLYVISFYFIKLNLNFIFPKNEDLRYLVKTFSLYEYFKFIDDLFNFHQTINKSTLEELAPIRGFYIFSRSFAFVNIIYFFIVLINFKLKLALIIFLIFTIFITLSALSFTYVIITLFETLKIKFILNKDFREISKLFIGKYNLEKLLGIDKNKE